MIDSLGDRHPVEELADEFALRCRRGEYPAIAEYTARFPRYAQQIEELFPAVALMEQLRSSEEATLEAVATEATAAHVPSQLGDFRIIREIGRGGMGIVYEAEQQSLARRVAVKVLPKHVLLLDKHLNRFRREAQTAANLQHTNILPVYGVGDHEGLHYYVMPLVQGVGLDEILRELRRSGNEAPDSVAPRFALDRSTCSVEKLVQGLIASKFHDSTSTNNEVSPASSPRSRKKSDTSNNCHSATHRLDASCRSSAHDRPNEAKIRHEQATPGYAPRRRLADNGRVVARIGIQAAEALEYAHAHDILHRDIKPGNLLIDADGTVCVADFGLARAVDQSELSQTGDMVGTLRYMAPEQFQGVADSRSDIYSLGLTLYELLTLRPAFDETDRMRRLDGQSCHLGPVRPSRMDPAVPRDLETIILKCLAPEPANRYQRVADVASDLRHFLEDKPIRARRASAIEIGWRWCRRNPALASMSALAVLLFVTVLTTALIGRISTERANAGAGKALTQAVASSQLALDVLDGIYLKLSPDRFRLMSDSDLGTDALSCIAPVGRSRLASARDQRRTQIHASRETAALLQDLLVFYDRLADQVSNDSTIMLQSSIASRRVGDIRQRLGQIDLAEKEYARALQKLAELESTEGLGAKIRTELARNHNEIGNIQSARLEFEEAYESHRQALSVLKSSRATDDVFQYELARTYFFLSSEPLSNFNQRRWGRPLDDVDTVQSSHYQTNQYRKSARLILEQLILEHRDVPDYRFLLALCHRPPGQGPTPAKGPADIRDRQQAILILEELTSQFPDVADYRFELAATYAWIHTGLYRWERNSAIPGDAEESLQKALQESQYLATHYPSIPGFACSQALILAKLGTVYWRTGRLAKAEDLFHAALETQRGVLVDFPEVASHNQVVLEFLRLRLAQVRYERNVDPRGKADSEAIRDLLTECITNLTTLIRHPDVFDDRLAWNTFPVAYETLSQVLADLDDTQGAETAQRRGEAMRRSISNRMQLYWRY